MSVWRNLVGRLFGAGTVTAPSVAIGAPDTGLYSPVAGNIAFAAQGGITFRAQVVAAAVNYVQVQPSVTAGTVIVTAQGADANIPLSLAAKGTGTVRLQTRGATALEINATGTPGNFIRINATASGGAPQVLAQGSDSNVALQLSAKGTAPISASAPFQLPGYTVATLPAAATFTRCMVCVVDGTANKRVAISDGTSWRWPDGAVVS